METPSLLEDTLNPAARPASVQGHSAATPRVGRHEAFPPAEAPALVAERRAVVEDLAAVAEEPVAGVVGTADRSFVTTRVSLFTPNPEEDQIATLFLVDH